MRRASAHGLRSPQVVALDRQLPEDERHRALAQAAVYLAVAPKSNAIYSAYSAVKREVGDRPGLAIPMQLRNAPTRLMKDAGYGAGYGYAHDFAEGVAPMECLPAELTAGTEYYRPTDRGWERRIRERLREIARLKGDTS